MDGIGWLLPTILTGALAFAATNIDTLLLLMLLFSKTNFRKRHIVTGQYLGFTVIIIASTLGFFGKWIVPLEWIGLLGLVPIAIGIKEMRRLLWKQKLADKVHKRNTYMQSVPSPRFVRMVCGSLLNPQTYSVAAMTVGNGSDNISTYVPLFAAGNLMRMEFLIGFFLLLVGLWCYIGYALVRLPTIAYIIERYGHILLPFIFIMLGSLILIETGTFVFLISQFVRLK